MKSLSDQYACTNCGYVGTAVRIVPGSNVVGIFLLFLLVIPGIIYAIWQHSTAGLGCPSCRQRTLIPTDSPRGRGLVADSGASLHPPLIDDWRTRLGWRPRVH